MSERPLSPHLQVYRPQWTSMLSILHRITGAVLATLGALLVVYWVYALASGPEAFDEAQSLVGSTFGRIVWIGLSFCMFYHLLNGLRHLMWDAGAGLDLGTAKSTGYAVMVLSIIATVVLAVVVFGGGQ